MRKRRTGTKVYSQNTESFYDDLVINLPKLEDGMSLENITLAEILDSFEFLDDWEDKYKYIIDLGKKLPPLSSDEMTDAYKVRGCQSQVWLVPQVNENGLIHLRGDSDAFIVKGLVALVLLIYSGKTASEIMQTDGKSILEQLGLASHLSPLRANGLFSMVERIQAIAEKGA